MKETVKISRTNSRAGDHVDDNDYQFQRFDKNDVDNFTSTILQYLDIFFNTLIITAKTKKWVLKETANKTKLSINKDYR